MRKILITGKKSFVGENVERWLLRDINDFKVDTLDLMNDSWIDYDFSEYDSVFHVAGIAHVSKKIAMKEVYYKVNRDLAIEVAKKSKAAGVGQFIFMSSIIVYGGGNNGYIDERTKPKPKDFYGDSKLQAEKALAQLDDSWFKVVIIRPPMIYGKGSKGNYPKLSRLSKRIMLFPQVNNIRSMLHIDNLAELIKYIIIDKTAGTYFPQNKEYVQTSKLVKLIGQQYNNSVFLLRGFNGVIGKLSRHISILNKVFGDLYYSKELSEYKHEYCIRSLEESIILSETINEKN